MNIDINYEMKKRTIEVISDSSKDSSLTLEGESGNTKDKQKENCSDNCRSFNTPKLKNSRTRFYSQEQNSAAKEITLIQQRSMNSKIPNSNLKPS